MIKAIELNEKEMKFKSSAATNILYKKAFGEDVLVKLTTYTKNLKELKNMQARMAELREEKDRPQAEILEEMNSIMQSDAFVTSSQFSNETLPKLAYIMYLEANVKIDDIFHKLNEEAYLAWLMEIDQDELLKVTGDVIDIWQAGARTHSKLKN